jgi:hypothetical protein
MKLDRLFFEGMMKTARIEQEKAKTVYERQAGIIGFCEYVLQNCDFLDLSDQPPQEGVK